MNRKKLQKRKSNQGNSFVIVIATLSFLAVLTTALLVAVGVCYRMKAYDINSRDNFYYLEQAMDEIYEGVGAITMKHLNEAYNDVLDVIVVYDTQKKAYVTMDNDDANKLLDRTFMDKVKSDVNLNSNRVATIDSCITKTLPDGTSNGISLDSVGNVTYSTDGASMTIEQIVLKRNAQYSTVNTYKSANSSELSAPAEYVQSITTDLVISTPNFNVDFSSVDNDDLYDYVMISDMGIEFEGVNTRSVINGNLYAANDFYNKEYNYYKYNESYDENNPDSKKYVYDANTDTNVSQYIDGDNALKKYDGVTEKSMYSGLYVSQSKVSIIGDKIIVPGSIAAMNSAELSIVGTGKSTPKLKDDGTEIPTSNTPDSVTNHKLAQVWADNIVLGGYSKKVGTSDSDFKGADIEMSADAFISDDLELNATGSKYVLDGNYYGYSNATKDQRAYSAAYLSKVLNKSIDNLSGVTFEDGNYVKGDEVLNLPGQSHYNSSAIVVNGQHSELDLSKTDAIYIAGQAYVEMSKESKKRSNSDRKTNEVTDSEGNETAYTDELDTSKKDSEETDEEYVNSVKTDENWGLDSEGNADPTKPNPAYSFNDKSENDNYSDYNEDSVKFNATGNVQYNIDYEDDHGNRIKKRIQDYRTGESISVKSNQLAYIPPYNVQEIGGRCYVSWPETLKNDSYFKTIFSDLNKIPVVKTVVSGKTYYFYDFTGTDVDVSEYITKYAELFYSDKYNPAKKDEITPGELADLYDITNWKHFKVKSILIDDATVKRDEAGNVVKNDADNTVYEYAKKMYTQGAISVKTDADETLRVVGDSEKMAPLFKVNSDLELDASELINNTSEDGSPLLAMKVSDKLQERYKKMRVMLTDSTPDSEKENLLKKATETTITPINTYFDFSVFDAKIPGTTNKWLEFTGQKVNDRGDGFTTDGAVDGAIILQSNYHIYASEGDVKVKDDDSDGKVMGVVVCKGDVTFDDNVKEFHGLIVSGGKIKVDKQNINFIANHEVVKAVLDECSSTTSRDLEKLHYFAKLFRDYSDKISSLEDPSTEDASSMKNVSSVEYEDVLGFDNWRKNVN